MWCSYGVATWSQGISVCCSYLQSRDRSQCGVAIYLKSRNQYSVAIWSQGIKMVNYLKSRDHSVVYVTTRSQRIAVWCSWMAVWCSYLQSRDQYGVAIWSQGISVVNYLKSRDHSAVCITTWSQGIAATGITVWCSYLKSRDHSRPASNMLKILPKMFSGISQIFHLLCSLVYPIMLVLCTTSLTIIFKIFNWWMFY